MLFHIYGHGVRHGYGINNRMLAAYGAPIEKNIIFIFMLQTSNNRVTMVTKPEQKHKYEGTFI